MIMNYIVNIFEHKTSDELIESREQEIYDDIFKIS